MTNKDCESSQYAYSNAARFPSQAHSANQRGKITRESPRTAIVMNTDSAAMPKYALGKLRLPSLMISACHDCATVEQETFALRSQSSSTSGCLAEYNASAESMNEAMIAARLANRCSRYSHVARWRHPVGMGCSSRLAASSSTQSSSLSLSAVRDSSTGIFDAADDGVKAVLRWCDIQTSLFRIVRLPFTQ